MKKRDTEREDDFRPEYDLPQLLKRGVRGKYAKRYEEGTNLVLLAPDVAEAFPTQSRRGEAPHASAPKRRSRTKAPSPGRARGRGKGPIAMPCPENTVQSCDWGEVLGD